MAKTIKIRSIDNDKSEKAALVTFEGDEYKQAVFLPKSVIEVDEENILTCSIDDVLNGAIEKAKTESSFSGGDGNKEVTLEEPSWDIEGRASVGFDVKVIDNKKEVEDFKVRVFISRSKIKDGKAPLWIICSSVARRFAEESEKKFGKNGIAQAAIDNPDEFEFIGVIKEKLTGTDISYQLNKCLK